jgi:hypothetical protein
MLGRNFVEYSELVAKWNKHLIRKLIVAGIFIHCGAAAGLGISPSQHAYIREYQKNVKKNRGD